MVRLKAASISIINDAVRQLDADEKIAIMDRLQGLQGRDWNLEPGQVVLFDPIHPHFEFGPQGIHEPAVPLSGNIRFGLGEWNTAVVSEEHELLPSLLKQRPDIIVFRPGGNNAVYICIVCDAEFPKKGDLMRHQKADHAEKAESKEPVGAGA